MSAYLEWERRWHNNELGDSSYGFGCRIARIRRGRYVRIPPQWRGKIPHQQTMRKRQPGPRTLTVQEQRALTVTDELAMMDA